MAQGAARKNRLQRTRAPELPEPPESPESIEFDEVRRKPSKKERLIALYLSGMTDLNELSELTDCRPSYVAQVLQRENLIKGYYDLYTSTGSEQNVYSRQFRNVLAFRDINAARASVQKLDKLYQYYESIGDRAGQHHATMLALIGRNRARWSGKQREAKVFHDWLMTH